MRLEIDIPDHHYNNIMAIKSINLGRAPYKGIIMYAINAIKHGRVLKQEPTTKNDLGVDLISREQAKTAIRDKFKDLPSRVEINTILNELPSVTPQLSVPEITALAEWTTKLTEANKSAYSQGYADGMKAQAEPKTGHCKDCKWWKDSDGVYRRGVGAESQCPINRREVFEGNGYCYIFEPQESEET